MAGATTTQSPTNGGTGHMLPAERAGASFSIPELQALMRGKTTDIVAQYKEELFSGPPFDDAKNDVFRGYPELFEKRFERSAKAIEITRSNPKFMADHIKRKVPMSAMFQGVGIGIHFGMFLTYLETQGSPEQLKKWRPKARQGRFFGAYAQTELGHGSNIRALETTATYDVDTGEFVIHSPYLTSLKWWPTGMYAATHGMVFARMIIKGRDHGFNGFLVQFRDDKGCMMPGVEVGEMGPKISGTSVNIGYARFTHVRIPRDHLFARGVTVDRDGTYTAGPPKLARFKYISMMEVRTGLVAGAAASLGRAATIAVRYSCVRRQGFRDSKSDEAVAMGENTVMDYQMQQYRTLKAVALSYMFHWNGKFVGEYLRRVRAAITGGVQADVDAAAEELPDLHATLAGLKATCTVWAHNTMEDCRKACGGQGYLLSNGLAEMTRSYAGAVTVEGEQVILSLQVARFLIKAVGAVRAGQRVASSSAQYLAEPAVTEVTPAFFAPGATEQLLALLRDRARRMAGELHDRFTAAERGGASFDKALNSVAVLSYKAAECHSVYIMAKNNAAAIEKYVTDPSIRAAMQRLFELMVLQQVWECPGDWIDTLNSKLVRLCHTRVTQLLDEIRPDAVALVDGFGISDEALDKSSTLGRYDGNVYEAIYAEAKRSPLNQSPKMVGWDKFAPVLDLEILREGMRTQRSAKL